jgi:2'-5' RNA ligase
MLHGIVSLLDERHYREVEELWLEFERKYNVSSLPRRVPYPHISLHVAAEYALDRVEAALSDLAARQRPIPARIGGLGVFMGKEPVLTLTIVRSPAIEALHQRVWEAVDGLAAGVLHHYRPENWVPHITLAQGDLNATNVPRMVSALMNRQLDWELSIDNLTLMVDDGLKFDVRRRVEISVAR